MIILGTDSPKFTAWRSTQISGQNNGAYWYAKELEKIILPKLKMKLFVVTSGAGLYKAHEIPNGAVAVCHDNRSPWKSYKHLFGKNILWICSKPSTVDLMTAHGENACYVPLSINTKYVKKFTKEKTKDIAFVGNAWGFKDEYLRSLPKEIDQLSDMGRTKLLREMAKYKRVIAEGRCLMEAQVLGAKCEVPKYKDLEAVFVEPLDSRDAIVYWKEALEAHALAQSDTVIIRSMKSYNDLQENKIRIIGEVFAVSSKRAKQLLSNKHMIVERV